MQYFEAGTSSSPPATIPAIVKSGNPIWIELDGGIGRRKITVWSQSIDCTGEIAVDAMGQPGAGVQQIPVVANGTTRLTVGTHVGFDIGINERTGKPMAIKVRLV